MLRRASTFFIKLKLETSLFITHSNFANETNYKVVRLSSTLSRKLAVPSSQFKTSKSFECTQIPASALSTSASKSTSPPTFNHKIFRKIKASIASSGPMTVAEYMRLVLTSNQNGYYMQNDVFGAKGDFITSPEISQMFGELVGVWALNEWMQSGKPSPFNIVEFGPGRGTMADDMLRVFKKFPEFNEAINLHFIEVSPKLKEMQQTKLCQAVSGQVVNHDNQSDLRDVSPQESLVTKTGVKVHWWNDLSEIPQGPSFYLAHEFFDALPIHKFQKVKGQWREVLISYYEDELQFVLSPSDTVATALLKDHLNEYPGDHLEISPKAIQIITEISTRINNSGGFALVIDYGHLGDKGDTFRAFSKHRLVDPLQDPGNADLTADVNFKLLKSQCLDKAKVYGPSTQAKFLNLMGIDVRLKMLLQCASEQQKKDLTTGHDMLTNPNKMGERFKFMAIVNDKNHPKEYAPAGFEDVNLS